MIPPATGAATIFPLVSSTCNRRTRWHGDCAPARRACLPARGPWTS